MRTTLFEWAEAQGLSLDDLAEKLGYTTRQLYRIRAGEYPVTETFAGRVILRLGEEARGLFFCDETSVENDTSAVAS